MTDLEKLKRGLRRIKNGWTQGKLRQKIDGKTCYCALGAMGVTTLDPKPPAQILALKKATKLLFPALEMSIRESFSIAHYCVVFFNDGRKTTKADVEAFYERAIALKEGSV